MGEKRFVSQGLFFGVSRAPLASHDSNPYLNRNRSARYNATKIETERKQEKEN